MMDDLKVLVGILQSLPTMALWVLVGVLIYKLAVVGSLTSLAILGINKLHDYLIQRRVTYADVRPVLDGTCIRGTLESLIAQLHRCRRASGQYIHISDVDWLREAIDDKIQKDTEAAESKTKP